MAISARNQLAGTISVTERGAINDEVELTLKDGAKLIALVTSGSQQALGLEPGREAIALINNREQSASPSQSIGSACTLRGCVRSIATKMARSFRGSFPALRFWRGTMLQNLQIPLAWHKNILEPHRSPGFAKSRPFCDPRRLRPGRYNRAP